MAVTDGRSEILNSAAATALAGWSTGWSEARCPVQNRLGGPWAKGVEVAGRSLRYSTPIAARWCSLLQGTVVPTQVRKAPSSIISRRGEAGDEIRDVEFLATLQQRRMVRTADLLTGVVHVDVHVAAEPAIGCGIDSSLRGQLDVGRDHRVDTHRRPRSLELEAGTCRDSQRCASWNSQPRLGAWK